MTGSSRLLTVRHVTVYRYAKPVPLGEHRMMFRPRESHDLSLLHAKLVLEPDAQAFPFVYPDEDQPELVRRSPGSTRTGAGVG